MARPSGWDILGLDGDPTPGVVESVEALAKQFGDLAHDVEAAYRNLNSFGGDASALQWVGQTADAFKSSFGPLPGRLQKLYTSYSEASGALSAYAPKLLAAQNKADAALRQAQDAHADLQRVTTAANSAADDLRTAQQNQTANPDPQAVTDAQTAHDTAQKNLDAAKGRLDALAAQAGQAHDDRIAAAKECAKALHHAQSDGIHNKHWWEHVGEMLSEWGGKIAEIANDLAPILDVIALATSWIPGVDVITAGLAEADNLIALAGTGMEIAGDSMQGHWGDALMGAGMLGATFLGGKALEKFGGAALEKFAARGNKGAVEAADPVDVVSGCMITAEADLVLPGVLPLVLRRAYSSGYQMGRLFGPGWSSTLDQRLSVNAAGIHFAGDDAQVLRYPVPAPGMTALPEDGARWPLTWERAADEIRITDPATGHVRHFGAVRHSGEAGQIRDLTAITDRNGNRVSILRDEHGTPVTVEHSGGYRLVIDTAAGSNGVRVAGIRLLDGSQAGATVRTFRYDERGRLAGIVNASGVPFTYEYDEAGQITAWMDRTGYRYEYEYDDTGRVVRGTGDGGYLSATFAYQENDNLTVVTDALGSPTSYRYDDNGHLVSITGPLGDTVITEFDRYGRLLSRVDAVGGRVSFDLDEHGNPTRSHRPDGSLVEAEYNGLGQITAVHLPDGAVWRQEYDERGNLISAGDPTGAVTVYDYAANGAVTARTDPLGSVTRFESDAAGLLLASVDPIGASRRLVRDAFGRIIAMTDPLGATTACGWTAEGLLAWRVDPAGARTEWSYDAEGQLAAITDPIGTVTTFEPGPFGQTSARVDATGDRYEFAFDGELRLASVTNPDGAVWKYDYDAAGHLVSETDFVGRTLDYAYDAAGRLIGRGNGRGERTELIRDAAGRIARRRTPDAEFTYTYDPVGRLLCVSGPSGAVEYGWDAAGRLTSEAVDGRTVAYRYDAVGRRTGRTTPSGVESLWSFDAAGRPRSLQTGAGRMDFGFDEAGREIERILGPRVRQERRLDPAGRPTALRLWAQGVSPDADPILGREWRYRPDGAPVEIVDSLRGTQRYDSDALGRVTAISAASWSESYAYDSYGNVVGTAGHGQDEAKRVREFDKTLIRRSGRTRYEHDTAGRLTRTVRRTLDGRLKVWEYTWDADDRLTAVSTPDGSRWRYAYDPLGRRTEKIRLDTDGSVAERVVFVWEDLRLAEQHTAGPAGAWSTLTWDYEPGSFRPAAQTRRTRATDAEQNRVDEAFHAIVADLSGAPSELVTPDGRIAWQLTRSLWGRTVGITAESGLDCPLRFPGQYQDDETGLHYNYQRYYDPDAASYISADPLGLAPAPNDYGYVSNPLTWIDPLGLCGLAAVERGHGIPGKDDPASVTAGGRADTQTVVAGHGFYFNADGGVTVPEGTYLHFYVEHGEKLDDSIGYAIEGGSRTVKPVQTFKPGDRVPNYTIGPPGGLNIRSGSRTFEDPTRISDMIANGDLSGVVHFATCREVVF